jgi:hypothetical protein
MPSKLGFIIDLGLVCLRNCQYRYMAIIWLGNSIRSSLAPHEKRESPSSLAPSQPLLFGYILT